MEEPLKSKLIQLWNDCHTNSREVGKIFSSYFGEENVDYQEESQEVVLGQDLGYERMRDIIDYPEDSLKESYNIRINHVYSSPEHSKHCPSIIIHFPKVTVTNEYDKSVDITHFYVKVVLLPEGKIVGRFTCSRSEYPMSHLISDYMHSHCSHIPINESEPWVNACTGDNDTPINRTISTLLTRYDPLIWRMFCCELDSFTQVESIQGTPYRRLEEIGVSSLREDDNTLKSDSSYPNEPVVKDFMDYYIDNNNLNFEFADNSVVLGMSCIETRFDISDKFIEWFNRPDNPYNKKLTVSYLKNKGIIRSYKVSQSKVFMIGDSYAGHSIETLEEYNNTELFRFKNEMVKVHIVSNSGNDTDNDYILLTKHWTDHIITAILNIINVNYGTELSDSSTPESSAETGRRRLYL